MKMTRSRSLGRIVFGGLILCAGLLGYIACTEVQQSEHLNGGDATRGSQSLLGLSPSEEIIPVGMTLGPNTAAFLREDYSTERIVISDKSGRIVKSFVVGRDGTISEVIESTQGDIKREAHKVIGSLWNKREEIYPHIITSIRTEGEGTTIKIVSASYDRLDRGKSVEQVKEAKIKETQAKKHWWKFW